MALQRLGAETELLGYLREYNTNWKVPNLITVYEDGQRTT
jgi:hypothetical protein